MRSQPPIKGERDWQVLDVCLDLHMSATGAADPLPDDVLEHMTTWLQHRVDHWHRASPHGERFDDAVFLLCRAALVDAQHQRERPTITQETLDISRLARYEGVLKTVVGFAELLDNKTSASDLAVMFIAVAKDARAVLKKDGE